MQISRLIRTHFRLIVCLCAALSLQACVTYERPAPGDPYYAPTISPAASLPQNTAGSLYQGSYGMGLFNDRKAHNVGDIITVTLSERTVSSKSSGVTVQKVSRLEFGDGHMMSRVRL